MAASDRDAHPSATGAGHAEPAGRVVFDLTTTAVWSGPPVGIVRVEQEFARWAIDHVRDLAPAMFDPQSRTFRAFEAQMAKDLIAQDAAIDSHSFVSPARRGRRKIDRIPGFLRPAALWLLQSRRMALQALERARLGTRNRRAAGLADTLQRALMNHKYHAIMVKPDGTRRPCLPLDMALGAPVGFTANDTLVCAGSGWTHNDIAAVAAEKRRTGFRFVWFCFDIIPLMFPQFYKGADVEAQRRYCELAFPAADLVVFSSHAVEADVRTYCATHGIALGATAVCPLGADVAVAAKSVALPEGLEPGHYALLVSTIEPRKGHRVIYEAWTRLLDAGIPQTANFKLVFAGRIGWMVDDLMRDLRSDPRVAGNLIILTGADDATVATLYRHAAFCLYPSRYEGYGLPVIEAFHHGKAVLASTGGAVPEVVAGFSPCLDPQDGEAWFRMMAAWIRDPSEREPWEARIREEFRHPGWSEAAATFFGLARRASHQDKGSPTEVEGRRGGDPDR